eukprot:7656620-Pyramimonas_sp.AAC.1
MLASAAPAPCGHASCSFQMGIINLGERIQRDALYFRRRWGDRAMATNALAGGAAGDDCDFDADAH